MFQRFHRLRADEEGQSIVLACVALLILALGVMATINLGRAIHQRVALQNTADASAYSQAAMEARAFNYYAFANRTQVVHYVSAMILQSYISFVSFLQAVAADVVAMLDTLNQCNKGGTCIKAICKVLEAVPVIGEIILSITELIDAIDTAAEAALSVINGIVDVIDMTIGTLIIPALRLLNWVLWGSTELVALDIVTDIADGYPEVITQNDDQATDATAAIKAVVFVANQAQFARAHNSKSGGGPVGIPSLPDGNYDSPNDTSELARAKRGMGEVTNATRYNRFVVSRTVQDFLPSFVSTFISFAQKIGLDPLDKFGQTKFTSNPVTASGSTQVVKNYLRSTGFESSRQAEGNVLGADDLYRIHIGPNSFLGISNPLIWGDHTLSPPKTNSALVSVWAQNQPNGGMHWKLTPNQNGADSRGIKSRSVGLFPLVVIPFCKLKVFYGNVQLDRTDHNHPWDGLLPFQDFEPGDSPNPTDHFNQPGTFTFLNKTYDQTKRNSASDTDRLAKRTEFNSVNTGVAGVGGPKTIDTTNDIAMPAPLKDGSYNVLSYGMAYYHRPQNWEEPPNFFNPYWRPKLEPVTHGLSALPVVGNVLNGLPSAVKDRILVH